MTDLPYAWGGPVATGVLRSYPEDFQVTEQLAFEPSGQGEHVYLFIEKRCLNTQDVVKQLAKIYNVKPRDIGYAGLKDRNAVTRQWFSIIYPIKQLFNGAAIENEALSILKQTRHDKKLKIGTLKGNEFRIRIRQIDGNSVDIDQHLNHLKNKPIPNYYTEQRFGNQGGNINKALALFNKEIKVKQRQLKGLYYSAARSYLFNLILAERVNAGNWHQAIPGDVMQFCDGQSFFAIDKVTEDIRQRIDGGFISPAGPLWGQGRSYSSKEALAIESKVLADWQVLSQGLIDHKLNLNYRHFCMFVKQLAWNWFDDNDLIINFYLKRGSYATAYLREIINTRTPIIS